MSPAEVAEGLERCARTKGAKRRATARFWRSLRKKRVREAGSHMWWDIMKLKRAIARAVFDHFAAQPNTKIPTSARLVLDPCGDDMRGSEAMNADETRQAVIIARQSIVEGREPTMRECAEALTKLRGKVPGSSAILAFARFVTAERARLAVAGEEAEAEADRFAP